MNIPPHDAQEYDLLLKNIGEKKTSYKLFRSEIPPSNTQNFLQPTKKWHNNDSTAEVSRRALAVKSANFHPNHFNQIIKAYNLRR